MENGSLQEKIGICTSSEKVHEVLICMKGNALCEKEIL